MEADWYEDPLGRFDGRFFDGDDWTPQVSTLGVRQIDPDFPPSTPISEPQSVFEQGGAAVEPVVRSAPLQASMLAESPTRVVAVLDESVVAPSTTSKASSSSGWRWLLFAALAAAIAIGGFIAWQGNGDSADIDLSAVEEQRVEDLEASGLTSDQQGQIEALDVEAPADNTPPTSNQSADTQPGNSLPSTTFDKSDTVTVGTLRVLNGAAMLRELELWHRDYSAEQGSVLGEGAGCWFGQLGDAAVQVAQCGPVIGDGAEFLFDLVPLNLEAGPGGGTIAQPVIDEVTPNAVLANALDLIGYQGGPTPPARGEG